MTLLTSGNAAEKTTAFFEAGCRWDNAVWRFPVMTAGTSKAVYSINWRIRLDDGRLLTDPEHAALLEAWKHVLWIMLFEPPDGHPRKGSYCQHFSWSLRFVVPWMVATGRRDLAELNRASFNEYLHALSTKLTKALEEDEEVTWGEQGITVSSALRYIVTYTLPYETRNSLYAAGINHPTEDPIDGKSSIDIAKSISHKISQQTPEVPDSIFVDALNAAMETLASSWLNPLIELVNGMIEVPEPERTARCRLFMDSHLSNFCAQENPVRLVRAVMADVRASCQILIQASSAIRVSELCGIETKCCDITTGLPGCIILERTFDSEYEIFSLDARLFKHTASSEPVTWVLGMRPIGSAYLPPPVQAIDVLARLDAAQRILAGTDALLVKFKQRIDAVGKAWDVEPATTASLRKQQQRWMSEKGCVPGGERITTHMWRKTFARYLVRVSAELLPAISHHLKHMSIAMTEVGYCRADPAARRLVEDARVEEAGSLIFGAITGRRRVEGPVAGEIRALGTELLTRFGNRPADSLTHDVVADVRERRIELYGNEVGWCVFRSESARCHYMTAEPIPAFLRLAPAFSQRRPEVCQKCMNFGIGEEHLDFWRARQLTLSDRLDACGPDTLPSVRAALERSIQRCETVLSWMGTPEDA